MTRVAVALGSNVGDRLGYMRFGLERLRGLGDVRSVSSLYETAPLGGPEQETYLNAVVVLDTDRDPHELLDGLQAAEADAGRVREVRWGPRTLDLDIVVIERLSVEDARLTVPHPRAAERRFVLEPLVEVWPDAPVAGETTASSLVDRVRSQELFRWSGRWATEPPSLGWRGHLMVSVQMALLAAFAVLVVATRQRAVPTWHMALGLALLVVGLWLAGGGLRSLGSSLTALPQPRAGGRFVSDGPYRFVRHPVYGGIVLSTAGASLLVGALGALWVTAILLILFSAKTTWEERNLRLVYPEYRAYSRQVRRRMIPWIW